MEIFKIFVYAFLGVIALTIFVHGQDQSGVSKSISSQYQSHNLSSQLYSLRSFPEGARNCYILKPEQGRNYKYLIRASFMYGNYDNKNNPPAFDLHLGVNLWDSITLDDSSNIVIKQILHASP